MRAPPEPATARRGRTSELPKSPVDSVAPRARSPWPAQTIPVASFQPAGTVPVVDLGRELDPTVERVVIAVALTVVVLFAVPAMVIGMFAVGLAADLAGGMPAVSAAVVFGGLSMVGLTVAAATDRLTFRWLPKVARAVFAEPFEYPLPPPRGIRH